MSKVVPAISGLHPLISVCSLLVFILAMAYAGPAIVAIGLVAAFFSVRGRQRIRVRAMVHVGRLRWFLSSIALLYCWGTPGPPLWPVVETMGLAPWWMPTWEGVQAALERVGALVAIVVVSTGLIDRMSRAQLLLAIQGMVGPLALVGFPSQRFALRLLLVLETIDEVRRIVARCLSRRDRRLLPHVQIGRIAARVFREVVDEAERTPLRPVRLRPYRPPPRWQWSFPAGLAIAALALA